MLENLTSSGLPNSSFHHIHQVARKKQMTFDVFESSAVNNI